MGNQTGNTNKKASSTSKNDKKKNARICSDKNSKETHLEQTIQPEEIDYKVLTKEGKQNDTEIGSNNID